MEILFILDSFGGSIYRNETRLKFASNRSRKNIIWIVPRDGSFLFPTYWKLGGAHYTRNTFMFRIEHILYLITHERRRVRVANIYSMLQSCRLYIKGAE